MKLSKRLLSMFVAFVLVLSTMAVATVSASADTNFPTLDTTKTNLQIGTVSVAKAGDVTVPVKINKNSGLWGANFQVRYDNSLEIKGNEEGVTSGTVLDGTKLYSVKDNVITIYIENAELSNSVSDGVLVNLNFTLKNAVIGETHKVEFTYVDRKSIISAEAKDLALTYGNGGVKVLASPATAKITSAVLTAKNVAKVTWGKAANATKYEVYRKVGSGAYSRVASTTALSYTDKALSAGKTYTYIVKTYNSTIAGALSATKSVNTLSTAKPAKVGLKAAKKSFTATRKTTTFGATGYQIQYSLKSNFKSAKTKTISKKVTVKSLKAKKKYYVRIRATRKISSKLTVYGTWSAAATIKTK